jgi:L-ribulose-5-phosphate 4-epimerase
MMMLEPFRYEIYRLNLELPKNHLVTWTSGNVSGRDPASGRVVIKPSEARLQHPKPPL